MRLSQVCRELLEKSLRRLLMCAMCVRHSRAPLTQPTLKVNKTYYYFTTSIEGLVFCFKNLTLFLV